MFGGSQRGEDEPATTNNVMSGHAHLVVQAGTTGDIYLPGPSDIPFELDIPELDSAESLLSFANIRINCFGRGKELAELKGFLDTPVKFSWWVWTGPAGIGKSRLAVELCRWAAKYGWHAGFLREEHQHALASTAPDLSTLAVVDYAAQRSSWLSDALASLSRREPTVKVRVLVLERDTSGEWWSTTQRVNRMEESYRVTAAMYARPRPLPGMNRTDARALVRDTAAQLGHIDLTAPQVEETVDAAERMDRDLELRPLFAQVAAFDRFDAAVEATGRDDVLRRIIARTNAHLRSQNENPASAILGENLHFFATALGGLAAEEYSQLSVTQLPEGLLPSIFRQGATIPVAELVQGMRPDIVGELFVLDRLGNDSVVALASKYLLQHAAATKPDAYRGFVERVVADHPNHPQLLALLIPGASDRTPIGDIDLGIAVMHLLGDSEHPIVDWIFTRIAAAVEAGTLDETSQLVSTAWFRKGRLAFQNGDARQACDLFGEAISRCTPSWPEYGTALNGRGVALTNLGEDTAAVTDFTAVIESPSTSAEIRACSLNNRADILAARGDFDRSIADRTAVLALDGTSYDRRYIALARRARTSRNQGNFESAYRDITVILETADIAIEQKMEARLLRAEWAEKDGLNKEAEADLAVIAASYRNFDTVLRRLRELKEGTAQP